MRVILVTFFIHCFAVFANDDVPRLMLQNIGIPSKKLSDSLERHRTRIIAAFIEYVNAAVESVPHSRRSDAISALKKTRFSSSEAGACFHSDKGYIDGMIELSGQTAALFYLVEEVDHLVKFVSAWPRQATAKRVLRFALDPRLFHYRLENSAEEKVLAFAFNIQAQEELPNQTIELILTELGFNHPQKKLINRALKNSALTWADHLTVNPNVFSDIEQAQMFPLLGMNSFLIVSSVYTLLNSDNRSYHRSKTCSRRYCVTYGCEICVKLAAYAVAAGCAAELIRYTFN